MKANWGKWIKDFLLLHRVFYQFSLFVNNIKLSPSYLARSDLLRIFNALSYLKLNKMYSLAYNFIKVSESMANFNAKNHFTILIKSLKLLSCCLNTSTTIISLVMRSN